jgi:hypothetical protein
MALFSADGYALVGMVTSSPFRAAGGERRICILTHQRKLSARQLKRVVFVNVLVLIA